jgi:hypothetical protein
MHQCVYVLCKDIYRSSVCVCVCVCVCDLLVTVALWEYMVGCFSASAQPVTVLTPVLICAFIV